MQMSEIGLSFAFLAGLASFFSPCVFALVPAYIGYLGGRSVASARGAQNKPNPWVTFSHGLAFVAGFSMVFIGLGAATSALGGLLYDARSWLAKIGGIVVIVFGLHMTGIIRIPFLEYDLRPQSQPDRRRGYVASFLMGIFFSAGWSPCVGPILGAILTLSITGAGSVTQGVWLLTAYSAGLAIPFLIASLQIGLVTTVIRKYGKTMHYVEVGMGVLLILVGLLLLSGRLETLAQFGSFFDYYDELRLGRLLLVSVAVLSVLGLLPAYLAYRKGRSFANWWIFGATLFPIALPMAWLLAPQIEPDVSENL